MTVEDIDSVSASQDGVSEVQRILQSSEIYDSEDQPDSITGLEIDVQQQVQSTKNQHRDQNNTNVRLQSHHRLHHGQTEDNSEVSKRSGGARRQHWKSQSMGGEVTSPGGLQPLQSIQLHVTDDEDQDDDGGNCREKTTFSANRELWQRRATSQSHLTNPATVVSGVTGTPVAKPFRSSQQEFREMRQKHTPDLVMDLPLSAQDADNKSASSSSLSSSDEESAPSPTQQQQPSRAEAATSPTGGPESPDMSTAAERFAKQNQCTLKKNTKGLPTTPAVVLQLNSSELVNNAKPNKERDVESDDGQLGVSDSATGTGIVRSMSSTQIIGGEIPTPLRSPLPPRSTPKIAAKFADMHLTGGSQVSSFKPQVKVKPTILRKPVLPFPHPHMSPELARKIEKQAQSTEQTN